MTAAAQPEPTTTTDIQTLQDLIEEHAQVVRELEIAAADVVVGYGLALLRQMTLKVLTQWIVLFGDAGAPVGDDPAVLGTLMSWMAGSLRSLKVKPSEEILRRAPEARRLGESQAREEAHQPTPRRAPTPEPSDLTKRIADEADRVAADRLATARKLMPAPDQVKTKDDLMVPIAAANRALTGAQQSVGRALHGEVNDGIAAEAERLGGELVWFGERDACLHCLAYIGERIEPGDSFPVGLTFGDKPLVPWPDPHQLLGPPLHNSCRCRLCVWLGSRGPEGLIELPEVLAHEAKRSVVKGFALPSESIAARARAADRLLRRGAGLPKTVEAAARRRLRAGTFKTGPVPDGTGTTER